MGRSGARPNKRLRQERERRNWSQSDVAEKLEANDLTVSRWERGEQQPSFYYRGKLCELFGMSAEELGLLPEDPQPQVPAVPLSVDPPPPGGSAQPDEVPSPIPPPISQALPQPTPTVKQQDENRVRMLGILRYTYQKLLEHSLHGAVRLALGLALLPDAVQNATNLILCRADQSEQLLSPGTSLLRVYEEAQHELLILGAPGSGKSTLLRELALQLVEQAEQDERQRLPVILPLSSWAQTRPPLEDWLSAQLSQIYDISEKLVRLWMQEKRCLFLLDGLDEMEEAARPPCIAAINAYHHMNFAPLVVCSRYAEYEQAARRERLFLQSALLIQPLSQEQVEEYLRSTGMYGEVLGRAMQDDPELQKIFTTPLMLNILTLAYHGESVEELLGETSLHEMQRKLFEHYVKRMLERSGPLAPWTQEQCLQWLCYLARQLRAHNQTIFYLEHLQPDWLELVLRQMYHRLGIFLLAIVMGVLVGLMLFFYVSADLTSLLPVGLLGGLLGGLFCQSYYTERESLSLGLAPVTSPRLLLRMLISLGIGLVYALCCSHDPQAVPRDWLVGGGLVGGTIGLGCFVLLTLFSPSVREPGRASLSMRVPYLRSVLETSRAGRPLLIALVLGLSSGLGKGLSLWLTLGMIWGLNDPLPIAGMFSPRDWLVTGLFRGLSNALSSMLLFGLICALIERAVSAQVGERRLAERMRWTWSSLLTSLGTAHHLRTTLWLGSLVFLLSGLSAALAVGWETGRGVQLLTGLSVGLSFGLSTGLSYWFLLGLWSGIVQEHLEDEQRQVPNQGIRRCLRNSLIMGIISGVFIGVVSLLSRELSAGLHTWFVGSPNDVLSIVQYELSNDENRSGILVAVTGGCFVWLLSGGWTVLRHYLLRHLLVRSGNFPWRVQSFLDNMTMRLLLRRVGGGYIFVHRLLLEYFADLER